MTDPSSGGGEALPRTALGVPNFRLLWINQITFFFVANGLRFLFGWVAIDGLGQDAGSQGAVIFALGVPSIFLLLPAGVWADRLDRRKLLIGTQLALAVVMAVTAILMGGGAGSMSLLFASAVGAGAATALGSPIRSSLVPELLPKELLSNGIAFGAIAMTLSLVFGALTARLAGDLFGFGGAFWYLAVLLIVGITAVIPMKVPPLDRLAGSVQDTVKTRPQDAATDAVGSPDNASAPVQDLTADLADEPASATDASPADGESMLVELRQATTYVWEHRALRSLFILLGVGGLIMTPMMFVTLQAFVEDELGRKAGDAAILYALMGIGLAGASILIIRQGAMDNKGIKFMRAMLMGTTTLFLMGRTTAFWQLMVLSLVMGLCGGFFINMNQSLVQGNVPQQLMGRVMGLYTLVQAGLTPIGALVIGAIAAAAGVGLTISVFSAIGFSIVLFNYRTAFALRELS